MKITAQVAYESGDRTSGISVTAVLRTAFAVRSGTGTTDAGGVALLEVPTNGVNGTVKVEFSAEGYDGTGVLWKGQSVVSWRLVHVGPGQSAPRRETRIVVRRQPREVNVELDIAIRSAVARDANGILVLADTDELIDSLRSNLPSGSMALVGKVLDGAIKIRAQEEGWWSPDFDGKPLGLMLTTPAIKARIDAKIGPGNWERLRGSGVYIRNVGAHQSFDRVSMEEALASTRIVFDFMRKWWGIP
jgi:hypothetical protein